MSGVIDAASVGAYADTDGTLWTYYLDADGQGHFYIVARPSIAIANGAPVFHFTTYQTPEGAFVSALMRLTVTLAPPPVDVQAAVAALLAGKVPSPTYQAMPYEDTSGSSVDPNCVFISFASADGSVSRTTSAMPSLSAGEDTVIEVADLLEDEAEFLARYFGGDATAGSVQVSYSLTATAHMSGITARVQFDSNAAYDYQRTFKWV